MELRYYQHYEGVINVMRIKDLANFQESSLMSPEDSASLAAPKFMNWQS